MNALNRLVKICAKMLFFINSIFLFCSRDEKIDNHFSADTSEPTSSIFASLKGISDTTAISDSITATVPNDSSIGISKSLPEKTEIPTHSMTFKNNKNHNSFVNIQKKVFAPVQREKQTGCFTLTGKALTTKDAIECSRYHWIKAKSFFTDNDLYRADSHCKKALSLYENGSLFTLKALINHRSKRYSEAFIASDISISRDEHWNRKDKEEAYLIKIEALKYINQKYPSSKALENIIKAEEDFEQYRSLPR